MKLKIKLLFKKVPMLIHGHLFSFGKMKEKTAELISKFAAEQIQVLRKKKLDKREKTKF